MRPPARRHPSRRPHPLACALVALALAACGPTPRPAPEVTPTRAATPATPGTPVVSVRRPSATIPPRPGATPALPDLAPGDGAALVERAIGLLLAHGVAPLPSGDLYGAAYAGAAGALRRAGLVVEAESPAFTNRHAEDAATFLAAYARLARAAAPEANGTALAYAAIRAATDRQDECNTALPDVPAERAARATPPATPGPYDGIGVALRAQDRPATIAAVYPDTPAARAGLRPGDAILALDGRDVATLPAAEVAALLRGAPGTTAELTIRRPGAAAPLRVVVARGAVTATAVAAATLDGPDGRRYALLRVRPLDGATAPTLRAAIDRLRADGVAGWVLDLREARGDAPEALVAVASLFLAGGPDGGQPLAYQSRVGGEPVALVGDLGAFLGPLAPLAVLTNGGTSGMPEVLAAALRERGAARLFGETTAGCVSVAESFALETGATLRIGTSLVLTPARRSLAGIGQGPDEPILGDGGGGDAALEGALRWLAR